MRTLCEAHYLGYVAGRLVDARVAVARRKHAGRMAREGWSVRNAGPLAIGLRLRSLAPDGDEGDVDSDARVIAAGLN